MKYEKTEDPNIIKQTEQVESEIHIDKLEAEVKRMETDLKDMPDEMMVPTGKEQLLVDLKNKQDFVKKLKMIKQLR